MAIKVMCILNLNNITTKPLNKNKMKNIHVLPTDKPSRLWTNNLRRRLELDEFPSQHPSNIVKHIYITSDEEIKKDTKPFWCIDTKDNSVNYYQDALPLYNYIGYKKIILTTDQDLINNGVQAIDDEFLEWFVKNASCESIVVESYYRVKSGTIQEHKEGFAGYEYYEYEIIIPKEKPKQERMYSEEDMAEAFIACWKANVPDGIECKLSFKEWFEQFKKK